MAEPIKEIVPEEKENEQARAESLEAILQQIADNGPMIENVLEILQELHQSGMLDIMRSILVKRAAVGAIAMEQINQQKTLNILRNGMSGIGLLSSIDPNQLERILNGITSGLAYAEENRDKKRAGVFGTLRATKNPNIQTSIHTILHFLEGMGGQLKEERAE